MKIYTLGLRLVFCKSSLAQPTFFNQQKTIKTITKVKTFFQLL